MIVPALVEMRQIAKTFGPVVALNGVDFTVHSDEVVGLVGWRCGRLPRPSAQWWR